MPRGSMVALPIRIRAVFKDGKFVPRENCELPEAAEVELVIEPSNTFSPVVADPVQRQKILGELVQRMMSQPLAQNAPKLSRDELHERR